LAPMAAAINANKVKSIELERKKASHIMHYLMERRQESEYSDPFELLKSMNDVIMAYEPAEKKLNPCLEIEKTIIREESGEQEEFGAPSHKTTKYSGYQHRTTQNSQSFATGQLSGICQASSTKYGTRGGKPQSAIHGGDSTPNHQNSDVNLPTILDSRRPSIRPESSSHSAKLANIKTFKQKQEDRILDIRSVIPDAGVDTLDLKYDRIKKLREEFNEIKSQFSAACASLPKKAEPKARCAQSALPGRTRITVIPAKANNKGDDAVHERKEASINRQEAVVSRTSQDSSIAGAKDK
jgi:hypothetical protein